jgi:hypothetical protein
MILPVRKSNPQVAWNLLVSPVDWLRWTLCDSGSWLGTLFFDLEQRSKGRRLVRDPDDSGLQKVDASESAQWFPGITQKSFGTLTTNSDPSADVPKAERPVYAPP